MIGELIARLLPKPAAIIVGLSIWSMLPAQVLCMFIPGVSLPLMFAIVMAVFGAFFAFLAWICRPRLPPPPDWDELRRLGAPLLERLLHHI